jgi:hypothetical protein
MNEKNGGGGGETERKPLKIRCCNAPKYRRKKRKKRNKNPKQKEGKRSESQIFF